MRKALLIISLLFIFNSYSQVINVTELETNFSGDSYPQNFTKGITKMYFSADDGINMEELWVYDTVTNTTRLVMDVGRGNGGLDNSKLMTIGDILYFTIDQGSQLWRSDGTEIGTYLVKLVSNIPASNNTINALFNYNGKVVFDAYDPVNGKELWISDGTTAGTTLLKDIRSGAVGSNPNSFFVCNGILYFAANDGINGNEIWKSDGTPAGTAILKNIDSTSNDSIQGSFIVLNNNFYFYCYTSANGYELWTSDGTVPGTRLFKDIIPGTDSSNYYFNGMAAPNYFIFTVESPTIGRELWKCDGTVAGTTLLKDINPSGNGIPEAAQFAWFNNKMYFNAYTTANGEELWVTDGTTAGTQLVKDIQPGSVSSYITKLTATSNFLIFSAQVSTHTYSTPWRSDGTSAGTFELKDTNLSTTTAGNLSFLGFNNKAFFGAGYNSPNGNELWITDGTTANTSLYKDIFHRYSGVDNLYDIAEINNKIIYTGMTNSPPAQSNGTINGTSILKNIYAGYSGFSNQVINAFYTKAGNIVFFKATISGSGYELWKTDGTTANTVMVKDIRPGSSSSLTDDALFISYNNILYFKADDGVHGEELWRSDGTSAGTYMVKDIYLGSGSGIDYSNKYHDDLIAVNENNFAILNGFLYFSANDGTDSSIWKTDGTESGTVKVIVIPSAGSFDTNRRILNATSNRIFFKSNSNNSSSGNHTLWSSDGTQAGTINLGLWNNTDQQFKKNIIHNNELYFSVNANNGGRTLMKSDGTISGTIIIKDNFTTYDTFITLYSCGNYVYFTVGQQSFYAKELWRTDGSTSGTLKLGDLTSVGAEQFIGCNVCHQGNLLYLKTYDDNKIWYVNNTSTDISTYISTNLTNSAPYAVQSDTYGITGLYQSNIGLFFTGNSVMGGTELYHTDDFDLTLDTPDFGSTENKYNGITIYPNPTNSLITIKTNNNNEEVKNIKVFDLLGKTVFASDSSTTCDLSQLKEGIYIVSVVTEKAQYNSKIIIRK